MKWKNDAKHDHEKWSQESSPAQVKSAWRKIMNSVHNKMSRGAEFISKMIPFARKDNWRGAQGHSPEKKQK